MTATERYNEMRTKALKNEITLEEWTNFVNEIFSDLLQENEETLKRLKEI